jgi:hypothetical protein
MLGNEPHDRADDHQDDAEHGRHGARDREGDD